MQIPSVQAEFHVGSKELSIYGCSTGTVSVKKSFRSALFNNFLAKPAFLLDRRFTEYMPIWTWLIVHPEKTFLFDSGENADVNNKDYFRSTGWLNNWINSTQFKFKVERDDEIDRQLEALGFSADDVDEVILSHMHLDHFDGLRHFPETDILVNRKEWEHPYGALPQLYPAWFEPVLIDLTEEFGPFERAKFLTGDRRIVLVETPGHSYGHCSLIIQCDEINIMLAADVVYYQDQLKNNEFAGGDASYKLSADTYDRIQSFARQKPLVFLPAHDAGISERLTKLISF